MCCEITDDAYFFKFGVRPLSELLAHMNRSEGNEVRSLLSIIMFLPALCHGYSPRGAAGRIRRLYAGIVWSVVVYGAPIFTEDLIVDKPTRFLLSRLHSLFAIRIIRGYRILSFGAAVVLAGLPSFDL